MEPADEMRDSKLRLEHINMLSFVADSQYGIPRSCPCGGRIIDEVRGKEEYDSLPGKRFFSCAKYQADGLHYRQPWVAGVQEEIQRLTRRLEEAEQVMKVVPELNQQIDRLEGEVYNLTVQVAHLEKLCFE